MKRSNIPFLIIMMLFVVILFGQKIHAQEEFCGEIKDVSKYAKLDFVNSGYGGFSKNYEVFILEGKKRVQTVVVTELYEKEGVYCHKVIGELNTKVEVNERIFYGRLTPISDGNKQDVEDRIILLEKNLESGEFRKVIKSWVILSNGEIKPEESMKLDFGSFSDL